MALSRESFRIEKETMLLILYFFVVIHVCAAQEKKIEVQSKQTSKGVVGKSSSLPAKASTSKFLPSKAPTRKVSTTKASPATGFSTEGLPIALGSTLKVQTTEDLFGDDLFTLPVRHGNDEEAKAAAKREGLNKLYSAKRQSYMAKHKEAFMVLSIMTAIFGSIFIFGPIIVSLFKFKEAGLLRVCIMITSFSYWIFWMVVYIAQINPLLGPRLGNATVLWISRTWGRSITEDDWMDSIPRVDDTHDTYSDIDESALK